MATYAIGDIQGCYDPLQGLLQKIHFDSSIDQLWLCGDLVNRGPESLAVLQMLNSIKNNCTIVLGNHDLHFLAIEANKQNLKPTDTLLPLLNHQDCEKLSTWLRHQSLLHYDKHFDCLLVHAGIYPHWDLAQAQQQAKLVETELRSDHYAALFTQMYGDTPHQWDENLPAHLRYRFIINSFTRMRFCHANGGLDLKQKGGVGSQPNDLIPWFDVPGRKLTHKKIIFGHWAALDCQTACDNLYALDSGCVWGKKLTALRLEDKKRFTVSA